MVHDDGATTSSGYGTVHQLVHCTPTTILYTNYGTVHQLRYCTPTTSRRHVTSKQYATAGRTNKTSSS